MPAVGLSERRTFPRYRAVVFDSSPSRDHIRSFDHGSTVSSRYAAQQELDEMLAEANPPYDGGYIEVCQITNWERDDG